MELLTVILLIAAVACFIAAAIGIGARINLVALGLACWATTVLLPHLH